MMSNSFLCCLQSFELEVKVKRLVFSIFLPLFLLGQTDVRQLNAIRHEVFQNSQVTVPAWYLTREGRPTATPAFERAVKWVESRLKGQGLTTHREAFEFGRGWDGTCAITIQGQQLECVPFPWAPLKLVSGETLWATPAEIRKLAGKLAGKVVFIDRPGKPTTSPATAPHRYTDEELMKMEETVLPLIVPRRPDPKTFQVPTKDLAKFYESATPEEMELVRVRYKESTRAFYQLLKSEGISGLVFRSQSAIGITPMALDSHNPNDELPLPSIVLNQQDYDRLATTRPTTATFEVNTQFYNLPGVNLIAELSGRTKPEEVVLLTAHLDSLTGPGATDNVAGVSVMLEAIRIIKQLKLRHDRTIRVVLFGGEEQGLLGSSSYAKAHTNDKIQAVLNLDLGSGRIRGINLEDNLQAKTAVRSWITPLAPLGATALVQRSPYWNRSDSAPFVLQGTPAFFFVQDTLDYETVNHSTADSYDKLWSEDLKQAVTVTTWLALEAANHKELLPRRLLPTRQ